MEMISKIIILLITVSSIIETTKALACSTTLMPVVTTEPPMTPMVPQQSSRSLLGHPYLLSSTPIISYELISPYHSCPRSMFHYLLVEFKIKKGCMMGPSGNECAANSECPSDASACCQQDVDCCSRCVGNYKRSNIFNFIELFFI